MTANGNPRLEDLRDQFAMAVIQSLTSYSASMGELGNGREIEANAAMAYIVADAMMKERLKLYPDRQNDLHLWSAEQVAELKRKGIITEDKGPFPAISDDEIPF